MTISLYFDKNIPLKYYENLSNDFEILFECKELSKISDITYTSLIKIIKNFKTSAKKVLSADIFIRECEFDAKTKLLTKEFLSLFDAIRIEDIGLSYFLKEKFPKYKLQIILEHFCHNKNAINEIRKIFSPSLEKIIVSLELEFNTIKELVKNKINVEATLLADILIFQTPRKLLLNASFGRTFNTSFNTSFKTSFLTSKELPEHKNLRYICNENGSFIFYKEPFNIIRDYKKLKKSGIKNFKLDFKFSSKDEKIEILKFLQTNSNLEKLTINKPYNPIFFYENDSDALFENLKKKSFSSLPNAEVIATISGKYAVIWTYKDFCPTEISYKAGDKTTLKGTLTAFNIEDKLVKKLKKNNIYYIKWLKKICVGSVIN
ncbi:MAG: U32 family peptidase [Bdellovibrionota bacterium]